MPWIAPDDVLERATGALARSATAATGRVCLARDLRGRFRVAVEDDTANLEETLVRELGPWFVSPVLSRKRGSPAHRRVAGQLLDSSTSWPAQWPRDYERLDGSRTVIPGSLAGRVALTSKESWLRAGAAPPPSPRVVSFFSFKGGVGRTTTLACVASRLATQRGLKVVAIDLDLEAPGTGTFLGARSQIGVVDHVLSHLAIGHVGDVAPEPVDGVGNLWVIPAGALGRGYLEKLARLDFLAGDGADQESPAEAALHALIRAVHERVEPDVVLLDCRAGLHDLGGLALHRLSHTDVLFARANEQARAGMSVVLGAVTHLRAVEERDVRLVQAMVPLPFDSEIARPLIESWRQQMYDLSLETLYQGLDEVPSLDDQAAHYPLLVGERNELTRADRLSQVAPELLPHFDGIADAVAPDTSGDES